MSTAELHTLTGAYAVHALSDGERAEFEQHLADCPACEQEVRELSATADRLALAASVVPPPQLKEQVLRRIGTVRQDPPTVPAGRGRRASGDRPGLLRRLPRFVLAACLAGAVALGGVAVWQHQQADDARQRASRAEQSATALSQVLAAPDARSSTSRLADGSSATVVVSQHLGKAAFLASGMAGLPSGRTYQLWYDDAGTMRPAGLMDPRSPDQAVVLAGQVEAASGVGVTVEPAGGSAHPTSDPVALLKFPGAPRA
jgi:anti-sigma-K factor RskA